LIKGDSEGHYIFLISVNKIYLGFHTNITQLIFFSPLKTGL